MTERKVMLLEERATTLQNHNDLTSPAGSQLHSVRVGCDGSTICNPNRLSL